MAHPAAPRLRFRNRDMPGPHLSLAHDTPLALVTLGPVALRVATPRDGERAGSRDTRPDGPADEPTLFDLGKPLALIAYLTCAPDRSAPREHLIDLLWGGVEPEAAKHALRQTLWYIRKRLGDRHLIAGGDVLSIVGRVDCDRDAFLAAADRGDAEAVVRAFTGDFFPGFAAPGGAEFERWADIERQRLRSLFCRSAETLVRRWMSALKLRDAQALARRVRDLDPLREAGWRLLFETLIAGGDTVGSALEADAFDRLVATDGLHPEPATRAMLRAVRQVPAPAERPVGDDDQPSLAAELVGREEVFAQLLACWESARTGKVTHVHMLAPAGIGKSRLLTDVHARLRATRARTLFVRASLGGREIPFGFAGDLAEALARLPGASGISTGSARALVALNPALSASYPAALPDAGGDASDALRRRTVAVRELIATVAEEQPIAIFIDDVQWADARSRQMIAGVIGALDHVRVLIVTASRPSVDSMPTTEYSRTIRLVPLTQRDVGALVASIGALPPEPWSELLAAELCDATAGSPLLVLETLQLLIEAGVLARNDQGWRCHEPARLLAALQAGGALRQRVERLDRVERWVLTLLAVAGVPASRETLSAAGGRTDDELASALGSLERRGLAARHGDVWSPSHDEIAAMAVELASEDARRAACRSMGRALLDTSAQDARVLRHAGGLLARAGEQAILAVAFGRFAHLARGTGDNRPSRTLAYDFLGERASAELVDRLVQSVPLLHRMGLYSGRRQAIAAALVTILPLGLLAASQINKRSPPDVVLAIGTVGADSIARIHRVPIRWSNIVPGSTIRVNGRPRWHVHADPSNGSLVRRPDNAAWTVERVFEDSGGIDLVEVTDDGRERRLTAAPGDDQGATWSPDGRYMVFFTARWNAQSHYDLAMLDARSGRVHSLTEGPPTDGGPVWSPDGSRIAFSRQFWTERRPEACVIDVDGRNERCFAATPAGLSVLNAWYDATRLVVDVRGARERVLGRLDTQTGAIDTIVRLRPNDGLVVSRDGRWVLCRCRREGFAPRAVLLFPIDEPNRAVEVDADELPTGRPVMMFESTARLTHYADRILIESGRGTPALGVPHLLTAIGISPAGQAVAASSVRWTTRDTAVATVDSLGVLTPKSIGSVHVEASVGGWRAAGRTFVIQAGEDRTLFAEDWSRGIGPLWRAFGEPLPVIDTLSGGLHALRNNGDGSFTSGVYTVNRFPTRDGLALDAWVSVAVTMAQWQIVNLALEDGLDDEGLRRWNHRAGNVPHRGLDWPQCAFSYPTTEGVGYGDTLSVVLGSGVTRGVGVPAMFRGGSWFHVRLQIFPDGRCGVAVNGVPVGVSAGRAITDSSVRVLTFGNSSDTKALVGPITLRAGVSPDVDWSELTTPVPSIPRVPPSAPMPTRILSHQP